MHPSSLDFKSFINPTHVSQGVLSKLRRFEHLSQPGKHFTVKTIVYDEEEILNEARLWEKLQKIPQKPKSLPKFIGSYHDPNLLGDNSNLVFEFSPIKFQEVMKKKAKNEFFPTFPQLFYYFKSLVNVMAFLQTMGICHWNLAPSKLFLDLKKQIYIIDLAKSKDSLIRASPQIKNELILTDDIQYFSPELQLAFSSYRKEINYQTINPYKADVFSLALIMLEFGNDELPVRDNSDPSKWKENIENALRNLIKKYQDKAMRPEEKEAVQEFGDILKKCLRFKVEDRLDFKNLFLSLIEINDQTVRKLILWDEEASESNDSKEIQPIELMELHKPEESSHFKLSNPKKNEVIQISQSTNIKAKNQKDYKQMPEKKLTNLNKKHENISTQPLTNFNIKQENISNQPQFIRSSNDKQMQFNKQEEIKALQINIHQPVQNTPFQINYFNQEITPVKINLSQEELRLSNKSLFEFLKY